MQNVLSLNYRITSAKKEHCVVVPLFLPFFGCPQICVFCNQSLQTGQIPAQNLAQSKEARLELNHLLAQARTKLEEYKQRNMPAEIAFYGGTFSALPEKEFEQCLDFIVSCRQENLIARARCSTRPDACSIERLERMKAKGIDTIELGVQTFSEKALLASNRGYSSEIIYTACKRVLDMGFELGVQLLPNLPEQKESDFIEDIDKLLALKPHFMRFYPCLVVRGTKLASMWTKGEHKAWTFETMLELLGQALYKAWQAEIPVIRIGVAPEDEFYKNVLAGVHHPALGQLVQARAFQILFTTLCKEHEITNPSQYTWEFPLNIKGFLMLKKDPFWKEQGLQSKNILWKDSEIVTFYSIERYCE